MHFDCSLRYEMLSSWHLDFIDLNRSAYFSVFSFGPISGNYRQTSWHYLVIVDAKATLSKL
jgi:hypothetical protein